MLRHSNRREFLCGSLLGGAVTMSAGTTAARASDKPHLPNLIRIKPLHFVDFITSVGAGKTTWKPIARENAFHSVAQTLFSNRGLLLEIRLGIDDVCRPCKYNADGRCQAYDGTIPDTKAIRRLGLRAGEVRKWNELVGLVAERVQSEEDFLEIFSQGTLESRFSYFKKGIEKLSNRVAEDRR